MWKVNLNIVCITKGLVLLEQKNQVIDQQLGEMQQGGRFSYYPKTILHPSPLIVDDDHGDSCYILLQPCGYNKNWYNLFDVVLLLANIHTTLCFAQFFKEHKNVLYVRRYFIMNDGVFGSTRTQEEIWAIAIKLGVDDLHNSLAIALKEEAQP
jgi:hypothetical protein